MGEAPRALCSNRKARFDYHIEETYEAGIALTGTEVKSVRAGRANLRESYGALKGGELYLFNCHISPYEAGNRFNHDPLRPRKLLLHASEIQRLIGKIREKGLTLVPLSLYAKGRRVKVELALAKGRRKYDKRQALKDAEHRREMDRALGRARKGD